MMSDQELDALMQKCGVGPNGASTPVLTECYGAISWLRQELALQRAQAGDGYRQFREAAAERDALAKQLKTSDNDCVKRVVAWLRESERLTRKLGKHQTAVTVADLADALERTVVDA